MSELTVDELHEVNEALLRRVADLGNSLSFVQITNDVLRQSLLVALRSEQEMRTTLTAAQERSTELLTRLRNIEQAAEFLLDYAGDMGTCAVCERGIGKSDEADGPECDCPARALRTALR